VKRSVVGMKLRALACAGGVLGVVATASWVAVPAASAQGNSGSSATITISCRGIGDLFVDYAYSGFPGGARGVQFVVSNLGDNVDASKGGSGEVMQAFNKSALGKSFDFGTVSAQLVGQSGKVIADSTSVGNGGTAVTC
jgi:hypothetical protein